MKILTIYDGTIQSKAALQYGLRKVKGSTDELLVMQVFQSSLFVDYDAGPMAEQLARAEMARHRRDAETLIREAGNHGIAVRHISIDGDTIEEGVRVADEEHVSLIITSERYKAIAKRASCQIRLVPGTILVPVDNSEELAAGINAVIEEAKITQSRVVLLGIIPEHLYSLGENKELEAVRKGTAALITRFKKVLGQHGLEVSSQVRSGYPDEEILKAVEEGTYSLVMLPSGGKTPSELTKAAAILLGEPERVHVPIQLLQPMQAS